MAICRTCTNECDSYKQLHTNGLILGKWTTLSTMLTYCTGLEFAADNEEEQQHSLPDQMCLACVLKLAKAFQFKQMVLDADETLRNALSLSAEQQLEQGKLCVENEVEDYVEDYEEIEVDKLILEEKNQEGDASDYVPYMQGDDGAELLGEEEDDFVMNASEENEMFEAPLSEVEVDIKDEVNLMSQPTHDNFTQDDCAERELASNSVDQPHNACIYQQLVEEEEDPAICTTDGEELSQSDSQHEEYLESKVADEPKTNVNAVQCPVCQKILKNRKSFNLHIKRHDPYNPRACEYCGRVYRQLETLQRHLLSHTGEKPMECEVCGRGFRFQSDFTAHMRKHTGERPFQCSYCDKTFGTKKHMKRHELVHSADNNSYPCDVCDKSFSQARYLANHKLRHASDKPYQCHLCGKSVSQQGYLKRHMLTHTGERPFSCDMCEKNFRDAKTLKIHKLHHDGIKPFECPNCEKNFSTLRQLKVHVMLHTGESPHQCEICKKSYRVARSLQRHMVVHTEERNHICEICGFKFRFDSNLTAHRRLHTRNDAKCPHCEKAFRTEKQLERHVAQRHQSPKDQISIENSVSMMLPAQSTNSIEQPTGKTKVQNELINEKLAKSNLVELY